MTEATRARMLAPLLGCLALLPGCLASQISEARQDRVTNLSRFDSGCPSMELVEQLGDERYKLRGCGSVFVYECYDRDRYVGYSYHHHGRGNAGDAVVAGAFLADLALTGGKDPSAPCALVSTYREPPRLPHRPVVPPPEELGERPAPASHPAAKLPELPEPAEVKRVMAALEPELRKCGRGDPGRVERPSSAPSAHPGWVEVKLRVGARGQVESASAVTALPPEVRRCVEEGLARAKLAPIERPVSVAYLLDLR